MNDKNKIKQKVAIIIDKEGWAFHNTAEQIKADLSYKYDIDIISMDIFGDNVIKLLLFVSEDYDLVFFMWRGILSWIYSDFSRDYIEKLGFEYEEFLDKYIRKKNIVTAVYDHLFIKDEVERTEFILNNIKAYTVCSKKLERIYNEYPNDKKPSMIISDGVNLELFKVNNFHKYDNINNKTIKIGWTGNSKFQDEEDDDLKGVNKIIIPAIEELKKEGYNIELDVADRNIKKIPYEEMVNYYNNIDIYVCASRTEGSPKTVLEAMACGVPVISTDVGIIPEAFGEKQKELIIERTKEDLKKKIRFLLNNRQLLSEISRENLEQIKRWSWNISTEKYDIFFAQNM